MNIKRTISIKLDNYSNIVVWGSGSLCIVAMDKWLPREKIPYIVDSNPNRHDLLVCDKNICSPDKLNENPSDCIIICSIAYMEIREQIKAMGFSGKIFYVYELFPLPKEGADELDALKIDVAVAKHQCWLSFLISHPQIFVNISYRLTRWFSEKKNMSLLYYLSLISHSIISVIFSIELPVKASIGAGFNIIHAGTIVFSEKVNIGSFYSVYHGCTVGTNDTGESPKIGNFVIQYTGSIVLGKTIIGDNSRIGANAVVQDLVSDEACTIVGIPAKIIKKFK